MTRIPMGKTLGKAWKVRPDGSVSIAVYDFPEVEASGATGEVIWASLPFYNPGSTKPLNVYQLYVRRKVLADEWVTWHDYATSSYSLKKAVGYNHNCTVDVYGYVCAANALSNPGFHSAGYELRLFYSYRGWYCKVNGLFTNVNATIPGDETLTKGITSFSGNNLSERTAYHFVTNPTPFTRYDLPTEDGWFHYVVYPAPIGGVYENWYDFTVFPPPPPPYDMLGLALRCGYELYYVLVDNSGMIYLDDTYPSDLPLDAPDYNDTPTITTPILPVITTALSLLPGIPNINRVRKGGFLL